MKKESSCSVQTFDALRDVRLRMLSSLVERTESLFSSYSYWTRVLGRGIKASGENKIVQFYGTINCSALLREFRSLQEDITFVGVGPWITLSIISSKFDNVRWWREGLNNLQKSLVICSYHYRRGYGACEDIFFVCSYYKLWCKRSQ